MSAQVKILAGPARCGKMQRLLQRYRQRLSEQTVGRCCWLSPNQSALAQLQESLLEGSETAFLQPNLFTFASFAESIIASSDRQIRPISSTQKRRLLQHVIETAKKQRQLEHFALVASTPGFVLQVDDFIAEKKRADVWPDVFEQQCSSPMTSRRSREFSVLYSAYQKLLIQGDLYDGEGRFWAARDILSSASAPASPASSMPATASTSSAPSRFDLVVVNGFNDFTAAQYDILRLLGESCSEMLIALTCDDASDGAESLLFAKTGQTLARLRETLPQLEVEAMEDSAVSDHSLRQLQQQLFCEPPKEISKAGANKAESGGGKAESKKKFAGVEILAANSELGEVEAVAERIKALLQGRRVQPEEIVVVCRGGESMGAMVDAVFPDFGIPFASELRPRLETEPLVRTLFTLLRLHQEDWPFQTLLDVINNRLLTKFDEGADLATHFAMQPRVAVEHCLRGAQLPKGRAALLEQLAFRLNRAAQDEGGETGQRVAQVSVALGELRQLDEIFATLPAEAQIGDWAKSLGLLLVQLGVIEPYAEKRSRSGDAWNLLRRGLREIERVDAWSLPEERQLSLVEVQEVLVAIARQQRMPAANDSAGRVRILSAESARKLSVKHLFLAGLGEKAFSSMPVSDTSNATGNATDNATDNATETEATDSPSSEQPKAMAEANVRRGEAMLLFYELATRPTVSLTLSFSALDAKGQPLSPSPLLVDLERSVGEGCIAWTTLALGQVADAEATPHSRSSFRRQAVAQALDGKPRWLAGMVSHPNFVRAGSSILNGIDCIAGRSIRDGYGPYEGLLLSGEAKESLAQRFNTEHLWSPSRLEGYAACPFRHFAEKILKLEPIGELTLQNDPRRRGSLLHEVLATIHAELRREESNQEANEANEADEGELVRRFLEALKSAVEASPLRGIAQSLREIERREIEAWAPDYAKQEMSYRDLWKHLDEPPRPAHFEVRFGPETRSSAGEVADRASTTVPFELDLGDEKLLLTGAIDRVDIGSAGGVTLFNVIDYKSGKGVKLNFDKIRSGHQMQLPLYAMAAEQLLLAEQGTLALATGYWNIQGSGFVNPRGNPLQLEFRELVDQGLKTSADWKKLQPDILARVQEIVSSIRDGQFPVYNEDEHCTRSCSLSTVCRVGQIRSLEKVWPVEEDDQVTEEQPEDE